MALVEVVEPDPEFADNAEIPGWAERITVRGFRIVSLETKADPLKRDPKWLERERLKFTSEAAFRREYKLDWNAGEGDLFFPEWFENGGREAYVRPITYLLPGPVYRGWDFGRRAPAVVWFQYDAKQHRVLVLRSLTPTFMGVHNFRDLALYLSGQRPYSSLTGQEATAWLEKIEADPTQPPTPWFQSVGATPLTFVDFGGWEATHDSDMVREETLSKTRADVLAEEGVYLTQVSAARDRDTLTRRMLEIRPEDGLPRTIIDPSNELLISAFAGGLSFKKPTPEDPLPTKYQKDGTHDNVYEAYTYGEVGVVPLNRPKPGAAKVSYPDRLRVVEDDALPSFGFHEGRPTYPSW